MRLITPTWTNQNFANSDLFDQMERFFEDLPSVGTGRFYDERNFTPATDISENDDSYTISFDIPGMKKEDIKIEIDSNILMISGERKRENKTDKKDKIQRFEKTYGFFKRSFSLPQGIDPNGIQANYENGVLELALPKTAEAKPRRIEIQSGKNGFMSKLLGTKNEKSIEKQPDKSHAS